MADISGAGDCRGEDDAALFLQTDKGVAAGGIVRRDIIAGDRNQTAAFSETRQRRADMADGGFGKASLDMG